MTLHDPEATVDAGRRLAHAIAGAGAQALVVYLEGQLGSGKTTFARGILAGLGYSGRVPSPTYTLVEPYELPAGRVYHIDLYRVGHARELDDLALPELLEHSAVALIEWPEQGAGHLPPADLCARLELCAHGRRLSIEARSNRGRQVMHSLGA
jgi:tRNA threonylcarbamoyladenosine biosynthesis protein TsaE